MWLGHNSQMRRENVDRNSERVKAAADENEIWKIAADITNPHSENIWSMKNENGIGETREEQTIADNFNKFFANKIHNIKQ